MVQLKIIQDLRKQKSDLTYPIYFRLTEYNRSIYLSSGYSINKEHWDKQACKVVKNHPNAAIINASLSKRYFEIQKTAIKLEDEGRFTFAYLKEMLGVETRKSVVTVKEFTDGLIADMLMLICSVALNSFAQDNYQTFQSKGFKVKCDCKLQINSVFIQMAKQQGVKSVLAAYICAENEDNPITGVIVNVNIYDESESYKNIQQSNYETIDKKYIDQYISGLTYSGIKYKIITYQGVQAIEYTFNQMGLPTTAIVFLKNKKSYLLQVSTRNNLTTKFNALKLSFSLL